MCRPLRSLHLCIFAWAHAWRARVSDHFRAGYIIERELCLGSVQNTKNGISYNGEHINKAPRSVGRFLSFFLSLSLFGNVISFSVLRLAAAFRVHNRFSFHNFAIGFCLCVSCVVCVGGNEAASVGGLRWLGSKRLERSSDHYIKFVLVHVFYFLFCVH